MTPLIHLMLLLGVWMICQPLPQKASVPMLTICGIGAVTIFAPVAAFVILLSACQAALLVLIFARLDRKNSWRKWGTYILFLNLLFVDFNEQILGMPVATLAISFSLIRIFMTARQLLSSRKGLHNPDLIWIFYAAFYLPALVIGPVFSGTDLQKQYRQNSAPSPTLRDARMVLQGLVLSLLVAAALFRYAMEISMPTPVQAVLLFLSLFTVFWGQSLIAEHSSRFFGITLPVNFDRPWKARTIKEFWQRWHRSMAQFVVQYIFLPLNLQGVSPKIATVLAFTFMGVWHNLSLGYLFWGLSHGILMAYLPEPGEKRWQRILGRFAMWAVVISLSWFANYGPLS